MNQRVVRFLCDHMEQTASWLDGLIGNKIAEDVAETVESIVCFQVIVNPVQDDETYHFCVVAVVSTR